MSATASLTSGEIYKGILCTPSCIKSLRKENTKFNKYIADNIPTSRVSEFKQDLLKYRPNPIQYKYKGREISISNNTSYSINVNNTNTSFSNLIITESGNIALICEDNTGRENNILHIHRPNSSHTQIQSVSKELVVSKDENLIYYIGASNKYHHYDTVYCTTFDKINMKPSILFKRINPKHTLHLASDIYGIPYLILTTYDSKPEIYDIIENGNQLIHRQKGVYYVGEASDFASVIHNKPTNFLIGSNDEYSIFMKGGVSILQRNGQELHKVLGWIDPLKTGYSNQFLVRPVDRPAYLFPGKPSKKYTDIDVSYIHAGDVPIICVNKPSSRIPDKTLIVFYGAYGLRTRTVNPYMYWAPLLSNGWRICFVLARGGGDNGFAWAAAGRTSYHKTTIEDVENSINLIYHKYRCAWERTAIYARSAGGIPAGIVTLKGLVGISFMEHPFVDIIETMGNPALPLTAVEYGEFGNPAVGINLTEISPMNCLKCVSVPAEFRPHSRILLRTGEDDTQVYPYEPLKFGMRLRELGFGEVLLGSKRGEGHFYSEDNWINSRAADLALLDYWASNGSGQKISSRDIKMALTHRNKNARRNKNKNSHRNKNKSKNMDGGKRKTRRARRATRRRVARKH